MSLHFVHDVPGSRVVFGAGARSRAAAELDRLGARRALLVSGGHEAGFADELAGALGERVVGRFGEVVMHVPTDVAVRAVAAATERAADVLLALGGGSSTGVAKAVARQTGLPIVAVPTTYAGSEMTSIWGLTEGTRKLTGRDERVRPRVVIYDPELTLSLPPRVSAASGMNALAHLVEGLYSPEVSPITVLTAQEGVRALAAGLPRVVERPVDLDARADALYGAWLAGWVLGTTAMGVHHKICHTLGGTYDLPHAETHSAVLPHATAFNEAAAPGAMAAILRALAAAGRVAPSAAAGLWDLAVEIGAPTSLADIGYDPAAVDETAEIVVAGAPTNPRPVTAEGIRELLREALSGKRP